MVSEEEVTFIAAINSGLLMILLHIAKFCLLSSVITASI